VVKYVFALLLAGVVLSAGCSRVKLGYPWLDWLLERQVNRYLDLKPDQERQADAAIDAYHVWHRTVMLPRYARFLRQQARAVRSGPLTGDQISTAVSGIEDLYRHTMVRALEIVAALVADQDFQQIDHLERTLAERHTELSPTSTEEGQNRTQMGYNSLL
jgi:hypothetical protein